MTAQDAVVLESAQGYISFKDVSVRYVRTSPLSNISFDISRGSIVAIVGPRDSAKRQWSKACHPPLRPTRALLFVH
jgi:ABC-type multidrug transport system fused ATPase/permease subunit